MYNLLGGVVHFFEDISADVISVILSCKKNNPIDIERLINMSGLQEKDVVDFLNQLVDVGLLTSSKPNKEMILKIRQMLRETKSYPEPTGEDSISKNDTPFELSTAEMRYATLLKEEGIITSAMFELTYNCSEKCIHCYNIGATRNDLEHSERCLANELKFSDYKNVIDQLYDQGLVKVCLTGGDPFSKPEIWDIIEYLYEKEIAFDIFTNGQRLIGQEERLAQFYPRLVGVSIYSAYEDVHDRITRVKGSLKRSISVMQKLSQLAIPLNLKCCVMRSNLKYYRSILDLACQLNAVPQIEVNLTDSVSGDRCVSEYLRLTEDEFNIVLRDKDIPLYVGEDSKFFYGAERSLTNKACGAGENTICITPDGKVIPCCTFHYSFGDIHKQSISEILSSDKRKWWLEQTLENYEECARHDYCSYCNLCPGVNFSEHHTPLKPGSNNCFLAKVRCNLARKIMCGEDPLGGRDIEEALDSLSETDTQNLKRIFKN